MSMFKKIINEEQQGEFKQPQYLDEQHQFRLNIFHYEFIITLINWRLASASAAKYRKELWEKMQNQAGK